MAFGRRLERADDAAPAAWIGPEVAGAFGTVGGFVPNRYESLLRLFPPATDDDDWWEAYRNLFATLAAVGARHTSTPDQAWFAVWEGHGFDSDETHGVLASIPTFSLPHRNYYLVTGQVAALSGMRYPGLHDAWRNPDLVWPDDRSWFVATDVDIWSLYVGGRASFIRELADSVTTPTAIVDLDDELELED